MRNGLLTTAAAITAAVVLGVTTPTAIAVDQAHTTAATASDASEASMHGGSLTVYEDSNFGGRKKSFTRSDSNLADNLWSDGRTNMNDSASSMKNTTSDDWKLTSDAGFHGDVYFAQPHSTDKKFSDNPLGNDELSAVRRL